MFLLQVVLKTGIENGALTLHVFQLRLCLKYLILEIHYNIDNKFQVLDARTGCKFY